MRKSGDWQEVDFYRGMKVYLGGGWCAVIEGGLEVVSAPCRVSPRSNRLFDRKAGGYIDDQDAADAQRF
ncbi:MAG: hypothetical protein ACTSYB_14205 [Candidatus Helarchaeota archaeon]